MNAATMNEMERLRHERDALQNQLSAALEREAALAAHVGRLKKEWEKNDGHEVSEHEKLELLVNLLYGEPATSLTRRDLIKQAEALEDCAKSILECDKRVSLYGVSIAIKMWAKDIKQKAQGIE